MKAIILAGGEGTRLQPLTLSRPKPMIPLFDRPLLEHLVLLLKKNGFNEICMTLRYLPKCIQDWFGNGEELGVWIEYSIESEPRGTAGSVRDCAAFIDGEDFLVISGDAACSFDLCGFFEKHRISGADATILTHACKEPSEYGLVMAASDGTVCSFLEKPNRENLVTNRINTGIYALSSQILDEIPQEGSFDFGCDLFPKLLKSGRRIRTWEPEGYWNDIGTPEAYLQTCRDVLDRKFPLEIPGTIQVREGSPFWVSPNAVIDPDLQCGPYAVIGAGSRISAGCSIQSSVLHSTILEPNVQIADSILGENVYLQTGARVESRSIISDGVMVGKGSTIHEGVRIWPGKKLPENQEFFESICGNISPEMPVFSGNHTIQGVYGENLSPSVLFQMGASGYPARRVAAASSGGTAAALLRDSFLLGSGSRGHEVFLLDTTSPASASFASMQFGMDLTLFVLQNKRTIRLYFFDKIGLPVPRSTERSLEAFYHHNPTCTLPENCHTPQLIIGADECFVSFAVSQERSPLSYSVAINGSAVLRQCLQLLGIQIVPASAGTLSFSVSPDGFQLSAIDENGRSWNHAQLLNAYTAICFSEGQKSVVLPPDAPFSTERIADLFGGAIQRIDKSSTLKKEDVFRFHWSQNAVLLCLKLILSLQDADKSILLADLMDSLPTNHVKELLLDMETSNISVLRMLSESEPSVVQNGLVLKKENGNVRLKRSERNQIRIIAESSRAEFASELCDSYSQKLQSFDRRLMQKETGLE